MCYPLRRLLQLKAWYFCRDKRINSIQYNECEPVYSELKPPVAPGVALAAPRLCSFSPTFFCTSLNLATHLSMQTLSPLFKSASAYRALMHLL